MTVPRQEKSPTGGRVNQKLRTRTAIVEAAQELFDGGTVPTVAQAAEAALVSRTTAYRYFPTQETLLTELVITADVDEIERLVRSPVDAVDAQARVLAVMEAFLRNAFAAESQYRQAQRLYQDQWLAAAANGEATPTLREGRRVRWFEQCLAPLRKGVSKAEWDRLLTALSLLTGPEALVVLRDVCGVDERTARKATGWAAECLLRETFEKR
jgi:AcrR family transcriptional regulator